jgi:hypothetical protein
MVYGPKSLRTCRPLYNKGVGHLEELRLLRWAPGAEDLQEKSALSLPYILPPLPLSPVGKVVGKAFRLGFPY